MPGNSIMPENSIRARIMNARILKDDAANAGLGGIGGKALAIVGIVIAAVVGLAVLANLFPTYADSVRDISDNVSTADWGDTTANSLGSTFAMVVSLGGMFAIIGLVFLAYRFSKNN